MGPVVERELELEPELVAVEAVVLVRELEPV